MATIETVLGPIDANELGFCLSHEHVMSCRLWRQLPFLFDKEDTVRRAKRLLTLAKQGGVDALIDPTTVDLGREVEVVRAASEASGLHVVVATGLWLDIPRFFWAQDVDYVARFIVHEIEHGIDDTGIKPGVIKVANDQSAITEIAEKVLRAAARAARETGVPITTHQVARLEIGRKQAEIFLDENVPMHLVCIGHSAGTDDIDYLEGLLNTGCYLSMDPITANAGGSGPDWKARIETVKQLIDRGWNGRLMMGHDTPPRPTLAGMATPSEPEPVGYLFLKQVAIPGLLELGITEEQVRVMMYENPKRFLTGEKPLAKASTAKGLMSF